MNKWVKLAGLVIGLGLFGLFLRKVDPRKLLDAVLNADPLLLGLAVVMALGSFFFRALRWRSLVAPVKTVGIGNVFGILMVAYTVSNLVPGRLGDFVVRPYLLGRTEGVSKSAAFATVVVERIFDMLNIVLFFALYLALAPPPAATGMNLGPVRTAGAVLFVLCLGALIGMFLLRNRGSSVLAWETGLAARLPERYRKKLLQTGASFVSGLSLFRDTTHTLLSVLHGLVTWLGIAASMYCVTRAFGLESVSFVGTFLLLSLGALGVAVPVPAGIGAFHFFVLQGLQMLGTPGDDAAKGAVLMIHLVAVVPVCLLGLYYWMRGELLHVKLDELSEEGTA